MKKIFLIRHAKSSWDSPALRDIERPLNERGLSDAPFMAKVAKEKGFKPDAILTSPAVRALTTATYFKLELGVDGGDFLIQDEIYEAIPHTIVHLINTLPEKYDAVMLFGHNPTFTHVANMFTNDYIANIPTCGMVSIHSTVGAWPDFSVKNAKLDAYFYPKQFT